MQWAAALVHFWFVFNPPDEIRGKDQRGKICEVEVSASGKVLEIE